jgi:hypothetical protein
MIRPPKVVRELNARLAADLGSNPQYSWRWSEDLLHVMAVVDKDGNPQYAESRSPAGLILLAPATALRKLLPHHDNSWVLCALVETGSWDGQLTETGPAAWMPVSGANGPVALEPHEVPNLDTTLYIIDSIRQERNKTVAQKTTEWDAAAAYREKAKWNRAYDEIRDAATAFYSVPGQKAHVSFPSHGHAT